MKEIILKLIEVTYYSLVVIIFSYVIFILDYSGWWFIVAFLFCGVPQVAKESAE